ncbi:MAG: PAS domain-containing protein [Gemmatimonadaceae bacterium]|nr:PAS domain-containing protein [Gemmatimonadaceae bacterium]
MSSLALLGWVANVAWLVQPFETFPPLRLASAVGLLVLGIGIATSAYPKVRWLSICCAFLALVIGSMPIQHAEGLNWLWNTLGSVRSPTSINWHGEEPSQDALSSAVFVFLGGAGLLAILARNRGLWSSIILAASGGVVMLLATTVIAGQALGFLEGVSFGPLLGSSLQSTICAIVFATHFNVLAWTRHAGFSPPPAWLPLSVGAGSMVTVVFVWRALLVSEEAHLAEQSRVAALATRSAVNRQMMVAQRNLRRMARFSVAPDERWTVVTTQLVEDIAGLEGIAWTDSLGHPRGGDRSVMTGAFTSLEPLLRAHVAEFRRPTDRAMFLSVPADPSRALMVLPRCVSQQCGDLFVGVVSASAILNSVLTDTVLGFDMAIGNQDSWFRGSAPVEQINTRFLVTEDLFHGGPAWRIGVWPSPRTAASTPSTLSDLVLLLGLAVSVLLAIALRLAQTLSQNAALEERAKIDNALRSTTDGMWEWDLQTDVVTRSPHLWARLGYGTGADFRRMKDWLALVHPQDRKSMEARLNDHLAARVEAFDASYRVRSSAGRWHDFSDRGRVVLRGPDGEPWRLLGMFADVTERRHAEESLRQAETMSTMGRLAARIAHEINNPLAGIQSSFLLIKDAIPSTHPHVKYVGAIEREIQRISQVTRQLYETYRPETESSTHAPVQTVVGDAVAFLEQVNRNTGVGIDLELGGIAAVVKLSDSILRQCVYNLVQNAIEASPPGSRVRVRGTIDRDEFVLRVSDQGEGVPLDLRESIFEPFVSTKASQLSTGGMGLGLSLVRRALDASGGSIDVIDAEGGGAEFVARIPLVGSTVNGVTA